MIKAPCLNKNQSHVTEYYYYSGLSLRARGRGFTQLLREWPQLLLLENRRKIEPKEIPSHLIPHLLVVFTRQLEILVTTLIITVEALVNDHLGNLKKWS